MKVTCESFSWTQCRLLRKQQKTDMIFSQECRIHSHLVRRQHFWPQHSPTDTNPQNSEKRFMHESFLRIKCFWVKNFPNHITLKGILSQNSLCYQQLQCFSPSKFLWLLIFGVFTKFDSHLHTLCAMILGLCSEGWRFSNTISPVRICLCTWTTTNNNKNKFTSWIIR